MAECSCHHCITQQRLAEKAKWERDQRQFEYLELAFTFVCIGGPAFCLGYTVCQVLAKYS